MSRLLSLALLPAAVLLCYVYHMDTIEKEPFGLLARLFVLGCLCALPAALLELVGEALIAPVRGRLAHVALDAFAVVAVAEEGCKLCCLARMWDHREFDYRYDAIVYAVCVSLGFAALENVLYVTQYGFGTGLVRAFTSVPGHCFFGVYMGYWFGRAKYSRFYGLPWWRGELALSLLVPVALHGTYDFCCFMSGSILFVLLFYGFLVLFFIAAIRCIRKASACDVPVRGRLWDEEEGWF